MVPHHYGHGESITLRKQLLIDIVSGVLCVKTSTLALSLYYTSLEMQLLSQNKHPCNTCNINAKFLLRNIPVHNPSRVNRSASSPALSMTNLPNVSWYLGKGWYFIIFNWNFWALGLMHRSPCVGPCVGHVVAAFILPVIVPDHFSIETLVRSYLLI